MPTAYVHLDTRSLPKLAPDSENEPRTDLLLCWKDALQSFDPSWEVKWTPLTHGKDKRPWIRFAQLKEDPKDSSFQEKCKSHLLLWAKTKGYSVVNSYFNPGGVTLCMASPRDVDAIFSYGLIEKIPGIPFSVLPVRGRQLEIENAFELAITGLSEDYDQEHLHEMIRDWLIDSFHVDDIPTLAGSRSVLLEPEIFIFHMTTWKATREVLSEDVRDRFKAYFKDYEMMQPPQLLYQLNTSGLGRKPGGVRKDLVEGASMVTEVVDKLRRDFNSYKETNNQLHQATQLQLTATTSTLSSLANTVNSIEGRLVSTQRAILFQAHELSLTRAMTDLKSNAMSLRVGLLLEKDEKKKEDINLLLGALQMEEERLRMELSKSNHEFLAVVQGASVGQLLQDSPSLPTQQIPSTPTESTKKRKLNSAAPATDGGSVSSQSSPNPMSTDKQVLDEVRNYQVPLVNPLIAANNDAPEPLMMHITRPFPCFRGVFDSLRALSTCCYTRTTHCRLHSSNQKNTLLIVLLLFAISIIHTVDAFTPRPVTSTLSVYALNANGLVQPVKLNDINSAIKMRNPQAFVLGETKTKSKLSSSLPFKDYDIYEESGEQDQTHHPVKWGIVVGIRKDIQIAQRVENKHLSLKGRVIALDLVLPTSDGRCIPHRLIGAYAPWNPGDEGVSRSFWADLADLCNLTPHAWSLAGDLNATTVNGWAQVYELVIRRLFLGNLAPRHHSVTIYAVRKNKPAQLGPEFFMSSGEIQHCHYTRQRHIPTTIDSYSITLCEYSINYPIILLHIIY